MGPAGLKKEVIRLPAIDLLGGQSPGRDGDAHVKRQRQMSPALAQATDLIKYRSDAQRRIKRRLRDKKVATVDGGPWALTDPAGSHQQHPVDDDVIRTRLPVIVTHETVIPGGVDIVGSGRHFLVRNNGSIDHASRADNSDDTANVLEPKLRPAYEHNHDHGARYVGFGDAGGHNMQTSIKRGLNYGDSHKHKHSQSDTNSWIHKEIIRMRIGEVPDIDLAAIVKSRVVCGQSVFNNNKGEKPSATSKKPSMNPAQGNQVTPKPEPRVVHRRAFARRDEPYYDYDAEQLTTSLTLPRIEAVLRAEGIKPSSITQQIDIIKERCKIQQEYRAPPPPVQTKRKHKHVTSSNDSQEPEESEQTSQDSTVVAHAQGPTSLLATPRKSNMVASMTSFHSPRDSLSTQRIKDGRRGRNQLTFSSSNLQTPRDVRASVIEKARNNVSAFFGDIEQTRWLSQQQIEKGLLPTGFVQPRVVLISSKIPNSTILETEAVLKSCSLLTIRYDFETASYESLVDDVKKRLDDYHESCKMKSLLIFCQGGPGFLYVIKRKVVTQQKLLKKDQTDLLTFWTSLGGLVSKLDPAAATIHFMGCELTAGKQGFQLFTELKKLMHPNVVQFDTIDANPSIDKHKLELYFDADTYMEWKKTPRDNSQRDVTKESVTNSGEDLMKSTKMHVRDTDSALDVINQVRTHNLPSPLQMDGNAS